MLAALGEQCAGLKQSGSTADAERTIPRKPEYAAAIVVGLPPPPPPDPKACLFIVNLAWRTGEMDLKMHLQMPFDALGIVMSVSILRYADGRSRGMAKAVMATPNDANMAITALDGCELDGRPLQIALDAFHPSTYYDGQLQPHSDYVPPPNPHTTGDDNVST